MTCPNFVKHAGMSEVKPHFQRLLTEGEVLLSKTHGVNNTSALTERSGGKISLLTLTGNELAP